MKAKVIIGVDNCYKCPFCESKRRGQTIWPILWCKDLQKMPANAETGIDKDCRYIADPLDFLDEIPTKTYLSHTRSNRF